MSNSGPKYALAIHGGAGVISGDDKEALQAAEEGLAAALSAGQVILATGGSAVDAVDAAVAALEDHPSFNAGRGSVYNAAGEQEMEASIMVSGARCGAVTLLRHVRNPIKAARLVMENTPHTFLSGEAAERFAASQGLPLEPIEYFHSTSRHDQLQRVRARDHEQVMPIDELLQHTQTVGAVAVDSHGQCAAATSTGGRTNKWVGRIGDTPIIGAGTYACGVAAVSGTGMGEQFIRHVVCHDICARMQYKYGFSATGKAQAQGFPAGAAANSAADPITQAQADGEEGSSLLIENGSTNSASGGGGGRGQDAGDGSALRQAVQDVVHGTLSPGDGGVIAVDVQYNIVMDFNTPGMYRGACDHTGRWEVAVFDTKA